MDNRQQLKLRISRARYNLMFTILLTIINIFAVSTGGSFYMPFSSTAATLAVSEMKFYAEETGNGSLATLGICVACVIAFVYLLCYFFSKKSSKWLFAALILFSVDTLILLFAVILTGLGGWIVDIALHALVLFYLVSGVKSFLDFQKLPAYDEASDAPSFVPVSPDFGGEEARKDEYDYEEDEDEVVDESESDEENDKPIRIYNDDGTKPMLSGDYKGLHAFVIEHGSTVELVINGYVCDELEACGDESYSLCCIVNEITFTFECERDKYKEAMFLYADDELLDSLGKSN